MSLGTNRPSDPAVGPCGTGAAMRRSETAEQAGAWTGIQRSLTSAAISIHFSPKSNRNETLGTESFHASPSPSPTNIQTALSIPWRSGSLIGAMKLPTEVAAV